MTGKPSPWRRPSPSWAFNHLEGHAGLTARLTDNVAFPILLLPGVGRPHPDLAGQGRGRLTSAGAQRSTMRWARPSTRPPSCWELGLSRRPDGGAGGACRATPGAVSPARCRCAGTRGSIFSFIGTCKTSVQAGWRRPGPPCSQQAHRRPVPGVPGLGHRRGLDDRIAMALERFKRAFRGPNQIRLWSVAAFCPAQHRRSGPRSKGRAARAGVRFHRRRRSTCAPTTPP